MYMDHMFGSYLIFKARLLNRTFPFITNEETEAEKLGGLALHNQTLQNCLDSLIWLNLLLSRTLPAPAALVPG